MSKVLIVAEHERRATQSEHGEVRDLRRGDPGR